jgi:hypothetical protein
MMAFGAPLLTALFLFAFSSPARVFLKDVVTCEWGVSRTAQGVASMIPFVLVVAITLTFVTAALQQRSMSWWSRGLWALCLLMAGPLSVPVYWFLHLRNQ